MEILQMHGEELFDTIDINLLCRICCKTSVIPLIPIYSGGSDSLASKIILYLPITISEDDIFPTKICIQCANSVIVWHEFFQNSIKADLKIKDILTKRGFQIDIETNNRVGSKLSDGDNSAVPPPILSSEGDEGTEFESEMQVKEELAEIKPSIQEIENIPSEPFSDQLSQDDNDLITDIVKIEPDDMQETQTSQDKSQEFGETSKSHKMENFDAFSSDHTDCSELDSDADPSYNYKTPNRISNGSTKSVKMSLGHKLLFDGSFFSLNLDKTTSSTQLVATCKKCVNGKEIKGSVTATSNFRSHLKRVHGQKVLDELDTYIKAKRKKPSNLIQLEFLTSLSPYGSAHHSSMPKNLFWQKQFESDVLNYVINSLVPLNTSENPDFRRIFDNMKIKNLKHISRKKLTDEIATRFEDMMQDFKKNLDNVEYICTTADIWLSQHRRFLGVTCHWIEKKSLERKSAALAFRCFSGTHSIERIAQLLNQIHAEINLNPAKITATITDNGSNFLKAYKEFDIENCSARNNGNEETVIIEEFPAFCNAFLPAHIRCVSYTLSLIATDDIPKEIKKCTKLDSIHQESIRKCSSIWSLSSNPKSSEILSSIVGFSIYKPDYLKWNSLYDSICNILQAKNKFVILAQKLNCDPITPKDISYLEEFVRCMNPLATAFDRLQGENNLYFGYLLPTILELRKKCEKMLKTETIIYCKPILKCILSSLERRFPQFVSFNADANNAVISTFCHPLFKTKWLAAVQESQRDKLRTVFMDTVYEESKSFYADKKTNIKKSNSFELDHEEFYFGEIDSEDMEDRPKLTSPAELEALKFFADNRKEITLLEEYPIIRHMFLKYNTNLPSSAPIERLFSYTSKMNIAQYGSVYDEYFEERVLLRANKNLYL